MKEELRNLFKTPEWEAYLNLLEQVMANHFMSMMQLDASKPESFIKFVELKGRIDLIRDITYVTELDTAEQTEVQEVNDSYTKRFLRVFKTIFTRS